MPKQISIRRGLVSVLFWSIISAAFIGPGTVTTASNAGALFGLNLVWALLFSIFATIVLQEAAARITIASGKSLGEIIAYKYSKQGKSRLRFLLFFAVAFGCAAYQAGNMLGALSGLQLFFRFPQGWATVGLGIFCVALLWIGSFRIIANILGLVVALMGVLFCVVAFRVDIPGSEWLAGFFFPKAPEGSLLLVISLIGTTIVPYNLFLASGISSRQSVQEMRLGITLAILIGGVISLAIMIVGTAVEGVFSFEALAEAMANRLGPWAITFFGLGLFAAGMSSSITSPLAAAVTARSLFGAENEEWSVHSKNFRLVWGVILGIGMIFGFLNVKPIPAIILAQAVNGILLPVVAIFLLFAVNDKTLLPKAYTNSLISNLFMLVIVGVTCFLGFYNLIKAFAGLTGLSLTGYNYLIFNTLISFLIVSWLFWMVIVRHRESA